MKEYMNLDKKYGVTILMNKIYVEPIKEESITERSKFHYIVEIVNVVENNGNGHNLMKIYTDDNLEPIIKGFWKISPIIKMPYDWRGYHDVIDLTDKNNNSFFFESKPDVLSLLKKISFVSDIQWVFNFLDELLFIEDKEHFELIQLVKEAKRTFEFYKGSPSLLTVSTLKECCDELDSLVKSYRTQKDRLSIDQNENVKKQINEIITILNKFEVQNVE